MYKRAAWQKGRSDISRIRKKAEKQNPIAAEIILADPERYGRTGLMAEWARMVVPQHVAQTPTPQTKQATESKPIQGSLFEIARQVGNVEAPA